MRHHLRATLTLAALLPATLAIGLVTACSASAPEDGGGLSLVSDNALETALVAHWKKGGDTTLASLTSFPWDSVRIYPEGAKAEEINAFTGNQLVKAQYYMSSANLFVFSKDGRPVKAVMIAADNLDNGVYRKDWPAAVKVEVSQPGQGFTTFVA